ncbi:MAG TPA: peptidoglycan DD-metalloendopeptidase family protein [Parasegetibacter sp.]
MFRRIIYIIAFLVVGSVAVAQTREELEKNRDEIQKEIESITKALNEITKSKNTTLGQAALLQKKLNLRLQAIRNINKEIRVINDNMYLSALEINKLKRELDTLKQQYAKSVVYAYKNRSNYDFLNFIFSASNFNDALRRVAYLKSYRNYREQQAQNIVKTQAKIEEKIEALKLARLEKAEVLKTEDKLRSELAVEKKEQDQVVSKLRSRENELKKQINTKKAQDQKLKAAIAAAIKREAELARIEEQKRLKAIEDAKKAAAATAKNDAPAKNDAVARNDATAVTKTDAGTKADEKPTRVKSDFELTPAGVISSTNFENNKGSLPWPVDRGEVVYEMGTQELSGTGLKFENDGITIYTLLGTDVKAVFDGEVMRVLFLDGNSQVVMIKHGKYFTVYSGVTGATVSKGQTVKTGQVIGKVAANVDGVGELDFQVLMETRNQNPRLWLKKK